MMLAAPQAACDSGRAYDWPIAGNISSHEIAGTYGPREHNGNYDFHRGVDILTEYEEPIYAIKGGVIKAAGDDPNYESDTVVITHCYDEPAPADMDDCEDIYFTHYAHLSSILVASDQRVERGTPIGLSGRGASGIAHVHFEVREGGSSKSNAIHPLRVLPYVDDGAPSVELVDEDFSDPAAISVTVAATVDAQEMDLARVEVELVDISSGRSITSQAFDLEEWNRVNSDSVDTASQDGVTIVPIDFDAGQPAKTVNVDFHALVSDTRREEVRVIVRAADITGNVAEIER